MATHKKYKKSNKKPKNDWTKKEIRAYCRYCLIFNTLNPYHELSWKYWKP